MALSNGPNLGILVDGAIGEVHYDALMQQWRAIDALVQSRVKSAVINTPPVSPADGDCYVVPSGSSGVWSTHTNKIARYSSKQTAWEYYTPKNGWVVHNEATSSFIKFNGTAWVDPISNKADLVDGKVPAIQLPSYVDDILEFPDLDSFPVTGESGKIYVAIDTGNGYRWSGSTYVKVSQPLEEMPQAVAEAGTSETLYAATARRIRQAIAAWWLTASSAFGRTLANVADAAAGRTALGLGTVAVADVTTSATDTTAGRVTKVGDFGWGGEPETLSGSWNDLGGQSRLVKGALNVMTDGPITGALWLFGQYVRLAEGNGYFFGHILSASNPRTFLRILSAGVWQTWIEMPQQGRDATFAVLTATGIRLSGYSPYISQSTGDGSDTARTQLAGGGMPGPSRGAYINLHGNEHGSFAGYCDLMAGDTANGGGIRFFTEDVSLKAEFPRGGGFLLGGDNLYNVGSSSRRIKDIYLANAPTVSSDQALKTPRRDFLDAELDAIEACELGLFQWLDAVVDKGDAARLHAGVIAQHVVDAFASRGLDPYHYGPICRDPIFEDRLVEERKVVRKRQVVRTVPSEERRIEIIDGVPTEIVEVKHVEEPVFEMRPVVRQDGTPVMETVRVLQDDGTPLLDEAGHPVTAERPVLHQCPAMEDYDDIERVTEPVQTGWRYSIRYDELLVMLVAAERRKNARLAERITALEGV